MENGDYIVAIDLGTNTVAAVVGVRTEQGKVRIIDCELAPVQGMVRGEIKNIELASQSIKKALEAIEDRQQIKITEAYTGISGQHIRSVKYPYYVFVGRDGEIREEDVQKLNESMANVQAPDTETIIQIIPQNYIIDGEETANPVGAFGNKLEATFNFILGDSNAVSRTKRALTRVQVKQTGLFLNSVAAAESVATTDERQEGVVVVDLGGGTTDVIVFYDNIIRHVAIIPMGGNSINKDIRSYGILERHVENLKVKYGYAMRERVTADKLITTPGLNARISKEISALNLAAIIEARMLDIIDFVMEEVKKSGYADRLGAGVILTGGSAQLKELDALFKNYTGIETRVASPQMELTPDSLELVDSPALAAAVGILIKGMSSERPQRSAGGVARVRPATITAPAPTGGVPPRATPYPGGDTYRTPPPQESHPGGESTSGRTLNDLYQQQEQPGIVEPYDQPEGQPTPPKAGLFGRLKRRMESMFDVIEDNEI